MAATHLLACDGPKDADIFNAAIKTISALGAYAIVDSQE
jgi:hypothetical protein